jgi:arsenate reductase
MAPLNVLFVCTGNTARSILAEAILNHYGAQRFRAFSAGSHPKGEVNPTAVLTLQRWNMDTSALRSKSWDEFAAPSAPRLDFVFTVCDNAAGEVCPVWPGQPMTAHWGVPDPAAVTGDPQTVEKAFFDAAQILKRRIELMLALPMNALEKHRLKAELDAIGKR